MPWQSVHTGACQLPLATACPWMLCWNSFEIASWHCPHVVGTLNLKIGDFASFASRISCVPWQSVQTAAFSDPAATACPWTLISYEATICALCPPSCITNFWLWQAPQVAGMLVWCTRDFGSLAGSSSRGLPWQSTQVAALLLPP